MGIRYRSESKSSQQMHEYFDSKYGSFYKENKKWIFNISLLKIYLQYLWF